MNGMNERSRGKEGQRQEGKDRHRDRVWKGNRGRKGSKEGNLMK